MGSHIHSNDDALERPATFGSADGPVLSIRHALVLGLLHGPAELLPISSSAHITLVPWLARRPYVELDHQTRKSFEVALHAGTAVALLAQRPPCARLRFLAAAAMPPTLAGYLLHDRISRRLGTPSTLAAGLAVSSLATVAAEAKARRPTRSNRSREQPGAQNGPDIHHREPESVAGSRRELKGTARSSCDAGLADGLLVGIAQAAALWPGVSRSASAFAAARVRGFGPADAERLSLAAGLPVLCGAALLESSRSLNRGVDSGVQAPFALGAGAALFSTLAASRLLDERRRSRLALPAAAYRACLASLVIARLRSRP